MISAKFVVVAVFALVGSSFAADLDLRKLPKQDDAAKDLGLYHHVLSHNLHLSWFKPLVGKEFTKVHCGGHELWKTDGKDHELNELLVLVKCDAKGLDAGFAVVSELNEKGGLEHHYLKLAKDGKSVEKEYDGGNAEEFKAFLTAVLEALKGVGAEKALDKPYPPVPAHYFFRHLRLAGEAAKTQAEHRPQDVPAH